MIPLNDVSTKYVKRGVLRNPDRKHTIYTVIHHAGKNYALGGALKSIYNYHSGQWPDYGRIGYTIVLQRDLDNQIRPYLVNPWNMQSAHVFKRNHESIGICCALDNTVGLLPQDWFVALVDVLKHHVMPRYPNSIIVGHKEITVKGHGTNCPGNDWLKWKNALRLAIRA